MTPEEAEAMRAGLDAAKGYADLVLKPPLEQIGGLLSDTVGLWRLKNRVSVLLKAKRFCEERGIDPRKLLPDVFVPLLDAAGDTEDERIQEMYANLLAAHVDPAMQDSVHPSYAKILAQFAPIDAAILRDIVTGRADHRFAPQTISLSFLHGAHGVGTIMAIENLERLGILQAVIAEVDGDLGFCLTPYGDRFGRRCLGLPEGTGLQLDHPRVREQQELFKKIEQAGRWR